jgi:hypothetical protein
VPDSREGSSAAVPASDVDRSAELHGGCCGKGRGVWGASAEVPVGRRALDRVPPDRAPVLAVQAVRGAVVCLWSFSRLCVAVISRHSERQAALPRRWKRSILRLNLVSPKTGSIIALRLR